MQRIEVTESYWTVCWAWIVPYPCKKYRKAYKYCYNFSSVKDSCYGFIEVHYGCENGKEYKWIDGCFGYFPKVYRKGVQACFDKPLEEIGNCRGGYSLPHGDVPHSPEWIDGVAVGGLNAIFQDTKQKDEIIMSPPLHIKTFCFKCFLGKIISISLILFGLLYFIKLFIKLIHTIF